MLPEERADTIAALVEFLYTGVYTYASTGSGAADVAQGGLHVAVYAVADRYVCRMLAAAAVGNFVGVVKEMREKEWLVLWKTAYAGGLMMAKCGGEGGGRGLARRMGVLYAECRMEVVEVFEMYPALATDILERVVARMGGE